MMHGSELENPERDIALETREGVVSPIRRRSEPPEVRALREEAAGLRRELEGIRERLAAARKVKPQGPELHCRRCFDSGRNAALDVLEGTRKA